LTGYMWTKPHKGFRIGLDPSENNVWKMHYLFLMKAVPFWLLILCCFGEMECLKRKQASFSKARTLKLTKMLRRWFDCVHFTNEGTEAQSLWSSCQWAGFVPGLSWSVCLHWTCSFHALSSLLFVHITSPSNLKSTGFILNQRRWK